MSASMYKLQLYISIISSGCANDGVFFTKLEIKLLLLYPGANPVIKHVPTECFTMFLRKVVY